MNIVSVLVGMSLMGAAAPVVMDMSLQPVIAQRRALEFGRAETAAVTFAAQYEGTNDTPVDTDNCETTNLGNRSWEVTCNSGEGRFLQKVTRAFRLKITSTTGYTNPYRNFAYETPKEYSHVECLPSDPWGVIWYNEHLAAGHMKACIPSPVWSKARYLESNPDDWLYDLSDYGFGKHPDY